MLDVQKGRQGSFDGRRSEGIRFAAHPTALSFPIGKAEPPFPLLGSVGGGHRASSLAPSR
jgi:hypothetical protein